MKKLLSIFALLFAATAAHAQTASFNSVPYAGQASGSTTLTSSSITCSNGMLIFAAMSAVSSDTLSLSSNSGNTPTPALPNYTESGGAGTVRLWYNTCNGAASTYTLTSGSYNYSNLTIYQTNNGNFDVANACGQVGGGGATPDCSVTATAAGLAVGFIMNQGSSTPGSVVGWTTRATGSQYGAYDVASSTGSVLLPSTYDAAVNSYGLIANIKNGTSTPTAPLPVFSIAGGRYATAQSLTLTCSATSPTIHYTTNGTPATSSSPTYSGAISVTGNPETVNAMCAASGYTDSASTGETFQIGSITWYVRMDGGTASQCDGLTNAPYTGTSNCAVNHLYWLLNQSTFAWIPISGDTVWFKDTGPYYVGLYNGTVGYNWPFCGGSGSDCHPPAFPDGLKLWGVNKGACHTGTHSALVNPTKLIGINSLYELFVLSGTNGVDLECLDISSLSNCSASSGTALTVTNTALTGNVATYSWTWPSSGNWVKVGEPISVSGSTHSSGIFNVTGAIVTAQTGSGTGSGTFTIALPHANVTSAADTGTVNWAGQCGAPGQNNDYLSTGLAFQGSASDPGPRNLTLKDMAIHGLRTQAIAGGKINTSSGDTTTMDTLLLVGNGSAGWNYDAIAGGCGTSCESIGTVNLSYMTINWNGCVEVKGGATIGALGYNYCADQTYGGYGDGMTLLATGGTWNFSDLTTNWNTQDGFDSLHIANDPLNEPTVTATRLYSEGNEGASIKMGGGHMTLTNSIGISDCNVFAVPSNFPGNPVGWNSLTDQNVSTGRCRANDAMAFAMRDGDVLTIENVTNVGEQGVAWDIDAGGSCTSVANCTVTLKNTANMGFPSPNRSGDYMAGIFFGGIDLFAGGASVAPNNSWYHTGTGGSVCPSNGAETNYVCTDPQFIAESNIDAMNVRIQPASPLIGSGVFISGLTTDFAGRTRPNPPSIGAYESGVGPILLGAGIGLVGPISFR